MVMSSLIGLAAGAALSAGISAASGGSVGDILKSAAIGGGTGLVTAGAGSAIGGSAAGLLGSGLKTLGSKMGGQIVAEGAKGTIMNQIGGSLLNVGNKMADFGAAHGVKATIDSVKTAVKGVPTGGASAPINATGSLLDAPTGNIAQGTAQGQGYMGTLPDLSAKNAVVNGQTANATVAKAPVPSVTSATNTTSPPALRPKASTGSNFKSNVGKIAGQFGVQGALSLLSAGMAAKQAKASNNMAQQSLQFQKQTYNEQMAEKENYKTSMKESAGRAYESSLLFGSTLHDSESNSAILTSYNTGTAGDYSILTYSSSRNRDKT